MEGSRKQATAEESWEGIKHVVAMLTRASRSLHGTLAFVSFYLILRGASYCAKLFFKSFYLHCVCENTSELLCNFINTLLED